MSYNKQGTIPEGGWGYFICIGMALPISCALGTMPSFGLMFGDFLTGLGEETSAIALITSCFFSSYSFAGLFTHSLYKKFSIRSVGLCGAIIYTVGCISTIFVKSVFQLLFTYGILQGAGFGLMIPTVYTTFNSYFLKRRVLMMSITQSLIGLSSMIFPILVQTLMDAYGFRGAIAIVAALNSNSILGMILMHPVEWHLKKIPKLSTNGHQYESLPKIAITNDEEPIELEAIKENSNNKNTDHLNVLKANTQSMSMDLLKVIDSDINYRVKQRRASSIPDIGNWTGAIVVSDSTERIRRPSKQSHESIPSISKWQKLINFLDLTLLKDFVYVNIVLGISFALYSDVAFFTIQPMYLFEMGYSKVDTAVIVSIGATADLASRIFLALASIWLKVKARNVYLFGALFTIITRFAFLFVFDFMGMSIITAIMGFLRTWIHVPLPLVFAEYLSQERFPSGYGLFMFLQGNITFIIGPFVGWIRDITHSYTIAFHCLTFFMALCTLPWILEMLYFKMSNRKNGKLSNIVISN